MCGRAVCSVCRTPLPPPRRFIALRGGGSLSLCLRPLRRLIAPRGGGSHCLLPFNACCWFLCLRERFQSPTAAQYCYCSRGCAPLVYSAVFAVKPQLRSLRCELRLPFFAR